MLRGRIALGILLLLAGTRAGSAQAAPGRSCHEGPAALALAADARQASTANWGWGALFVASVIGHTTLALTSENRDTRVALWTGTFKSSVGVLNQILRPISIGTPARDCHDLDRLVDQAADVERRRRSWVAHAITFGFNGAAFAFVVQQTGDVLLASAGAISGIIVGELMALSAPRRTLDRSSLGISLHLLPSLGTSSLGLGLGGTF